MTLKRKFSAMSQWHKCALLILSACLIVAGSLFGYYQYRLYQESQREPIQYAWPPHFDYYGSTYFCRGNSNPILPDGYELAAETTDVGQVDERDHLEGNVSGYVYANLENTDTLYFQYREWDEAARGTQSYWRYDRKKDQ